MKLKTCALSIGTFLLLASLAASAETIANIDQMGSWSNCGACAGAGGHGAVVPYSLKQGIGSPSIDGRSAQFFLGGTKPYGSALWWKQLGGRNGAHHLTYDLYFYLKNPSAPQALEFDVNQSVNGRRWIFGTQCNIRGGNHWDVWDTPNHRWVNTGKYCATPTANKWHRLIIELERTSTGKAHFITISLDGKKNYVNRYYGSKSGPASELNVAFQMDGNSQQTDYFVWLDKVTLTAW